MTAQEVIQIALDHYNAGEFSQAGLICRQVLAKLPDNLDALQLLSFVEAQANRLDAAIELMSRVVALSPNVADYHLNIGELLRRARKLDAAIDSLRRAVQLQPDNAVAHFNLGVALAETPGREGVMRELQQAIELKPDFAEAFLQVGTELRRQHRFDESDAAHRRAIELHPEFAAAHWNYSLLLLQTGNLDAGWREYEWRRKVPAVCLPRHFSQPEWTGQLIADRTIFVHIEQAFGDIVQFARFIPMLAAKGARILLQSPPEMARLLRSLAGVDQVIPFGEPVPPFDLHVPLLSLARFFAPALDQIPASIPYLHPDPNVAAEWKQRLTAHKEKLKVGLVWSGRQMLMDGQDRSIPIPSLHPLISVPDTVFLTLQPDVPAPLPLIDCSRDMKDFADTAALISNLNLIITIDSAAAHLAGAMGIPVWTMLLYNPDWRWLHDRSDSPWYPTMRLFRQSRPGDWQSVIESVRNELKLMKRR